MRPYAKSFLSVLVSCVPFHVLTKSLSAEHCNVHRRQLITPLSYVACSCLGPTAMAIADNSASDLVTTFINQFCGLHIHQLPVQIAIPCKGIHKATLLSVFRVRCSCQRIKPGPSRSIYRFPKLGGSISGVKFQCFILGCVISGSIGGKQILKLRSKSHKTKMEYDIIPRRAWAVALVDTFLHPAYAAPNQFVSFPLVVCHTQGYWHLCASIVHASVTTTK